MTGSCIGFDRLNSMLSSGFEDTSGLNRFSKGFSRHLTIACSCQWTFGTCSYTLQLISYALVPRCLLASPSLPHQCHKQAVTHPTLSTHFCQQDRCTMWWSGWGRILCGLVYVVFPLVSLRGERHRGERDGGIVEQTSERL